MSHAEFHDLDELYELYVLGVLETEPAGEISQHLRAGCEVCTQRLAEAVEVASYLPFLAAPQTPPPSLRKRVVALVRPGGVPTTWLYALASIAAACLAIAIFAWTGRQAALLETAGALHERDELRAVVEVLSRPDTRAVQFGIAANPHGRVFLNPDGGVVFVGANLPQLPNGRAFELWLIPAKGAPQPLSLFQANSAGDSVGVSNKAFDISQVSAVAVSIEPANGSAAPTTKPILVVSVG